MRRTRMRACKRAAATVCGANTAFDRKDRGYTAFLNLVPVSTRGNRPQRKNPMQSPSPESKLMIRALAFGSIVCASIVFSSASAWAACSARFNCDFGDSPRCFFTIKSGGGLRNLVVPAGESRTLHGLQQGAIFCTSNQSLPNPNACNIKRVNLNCN